MPEDIREQYRGMIQRQIGLFLPILPPWQRRAADALRPKLDWSGPDESPRPPSFRKAFFDGH